MHKFSMKMSKVRIPDYFKYMGIIVFETKHDKFIVNEIEK